MIIGYTVTTSIGVFAVVRSDWPDIADRAVKRSEVEASMTPLVQAANDGDDDPLGDAPLVEDEG